MLPALASLSIPTTAIMAKYIIDTESHVAALNEFIRTYRANHPQVRKLEMTSQDHTKVTFHFPVPKVEVASSCPQMVVCRAHGVQSAKQCQYSTPLWECGCPCHKEKR